jgi:acetyltransferase-like isoleucine patch superfamily enzyme
MLLRLGSNIRKIRYRIATGGRFRPEGTSLVLPPNLIKITGSGKIILKAGAVIDRNARIVVHNAMLTIGADTYIGSDSTIVVFADVSIGARVLIGERVSIHSEDHGPFWNRNMFCVSEIKVQDDVWICAGTVLAKGSQIGARTTVGANSFVNNEIPPDVLAVGSPAVRVRNIKSRLGLGVLTRTSQDG